MASASVMAPSVTLADGLATTVMVMGRAGMQLIEGLDDCEAYAITEDGCSLKTSGFQER